MYFWPKVCFTEKNHFKVHFLMKYLWDNHFPNMESNSLISKNRFIFYPWILVKYLCFQLKENIKNEKYLWKYSLRYVHSSSSLSTFLTLIKRYLYWQQYGIRHRSSNNLWKTHTSLWQWKRFFEIVKLMWNGQLSTISSMFFM